MKVSEGVIELEANSHAGIFYGVQSLLQLVDGDEVAAVEIVDAPRYGWRGLHLDVSRHFFDVVFIKRYLDLMALYKYNVFHWHLSDDDGWRLESKKFPKLTEVGAYRSRVGRAGNQAKGLNVDDGKPYGGFYTREEVKEIIAYAKARHIEILPEIDVPGHSKAIVLSYPEYGTHPGSDVLNIGNPATVKFLEELFSEVAELFPFSYVHIGCDEVGLGGAWMRNADCQAKMKELGTDDPHVLHKWLVEHLQKHLAGEKKEAVAWCEVLDAKVGKDTVVMAWRDNGGWIKAPKLGHKTVVTPSMQTYFNYQEDIGSNAPGHGGYRTVMEKVYKFDPIDEGLSDAEKALVLGGQGCVWTEFIPLPQHVEYITYPRAVALSEALWSPKQKKDWDKFQSRLDAHQGYMDKHAIQYRVAAPLPVRKAVSFVETGLVQFTNPNSSGTIYYTTDGSEPSAASNTYREPGIKLSESAEVKAIVVLDNARESYRTSVVAEKQEAKKGQRVTGAKPGLAYRVFEKSGNDFGEVFKQEPVKRGHLKGLTIPEEMKGKDHFIVAYDGYLKVLQDGSYHFRLHADDAAVLYLNGRKVAEQGSVGGAFLGRGYHPLTVLFREDAGAERLRLEMRSEVGDYVPVGKDDIYFSRSMQPQALLSVETDMKAAGKHVAGNLLDSDAESYFHSQGGVKPGQHLTVWASEPKVIKEVEVLTGRANGSDILEGGILEVSYDGEKFEKVSDFTGGVAKGRPKKAVRAVRIKVIRPQGSWLMVRELNF
ncbi:family 20 glycosylhydrolase [Rubritalea tangerina]|uniref:beta-N-acetylhexosaminidase n=1 Tax=Rubritalea tangerina TaxID=430798 RepID=A0ABW4ZF63_9BACT